MNPHYRHHPLELERQVVSSVEEGVAGSWHLAGNNTKNMVNWCKWANWLRGYL